MSNEMIERVARKLWDEIGGECSDPDCRWGKSCFCVDAAFSLTKIAIKDMREPTKEMLKAFDELSYEEHILICWRKAIDAALKE
jgi:hypothetical protein